MERGSLVVLEIAESDFDFVVGLLEARATLSLDSAVDLIVGDSSGGLSRSGLGRGLYLLGSRRVGDPIGKVTHVGVSMLGVPPNARVCEFV